jgi:hypothetical protein
MQMNYFFTMAAVLLVGLSGLMIFIIQTRESGQSIHGALREGMVWGLSFIVSFSSELWLLGANLLII